MKFNCLSKIVSDDFCENTAESSSVSPDPVVMFRQQGDGLPALDQTVLLTQARSSLSLIPLHTACEAVMRIY